MNYLRNLALNNSFRNNKLLQFILICAVFLFFSYNYFFIENFPIQDDVNYILMTSSLEKYSFFSVKFISYILQFENDHITIIPKLMILIDYWIFGILNFRHIIVIGILFFFLFCYLIYLEFQKLHLSLWFIIPVLGLLFQPQYHELFNWACTGITQFTMIFFTFLSFRYLHSSNRYAIIIVGLCCLFAAYSFGNGIIAFGINLFVLLISKQFKKTILLSIFMLPFIANYLVFYHKGPETLSHFNLNNFIAIFLSLTGSIFINLSQVNGLIFTIIGGFIAVILSFYYFFKNIFTNLPKHFNATNQLLYFCLLSLLLIAVTRSGSGIFIFRSSRYLFYSPVIFTCLYFQFIQTNSLIVIKSKLIYFSFIIFATGISLSSYYFNTDLLFNRKKNLIADSENWSKNYRTISISPKVYQNIQNELIQSFSERIWTIEPENIFNIQKILNCSQEISIKNKTMISQNNLMKEASNPVQSFNYLKLEFDKIPISFDNILPEWYVVYLSTDSKFEFITPLNFKKGPKKDLLFKLDYFSKEAYTSISNLNIPENTYQVYLVKKSNKFNYYKTDLFLQYEKGKLKKI